MRKRIAIIVGMVLCGLAAFLLIREPACACGEFSLVSGGLSGEALLRPNDPIPVPTGPIELTLSGKIGVTNAAGRLDFDRATLKRMRMIGYKVDDPRLKRPTFYTGVVLADLLELAHISPDATTLRATTGDGQHIDVPIAVARWPVIIATERDDAGVAGKQGKTAIPLQLVFPYLPEPVQWNDATFTIDDRQTYDQLWVQQLRSLEVR